MTISRNFYDNFKKFNIYETQFAQRAVDHLHAVFSDSLTQSQIECSGCCSRTTSFFFFYISIKKGDRDQTILERIISSQLVHLRELEKRAETRYLPACLLASFRVVPSDSKSNHWIVQVAKLAQLSSVRLDGIMNEWMNDSAEFCFLMAPT